MSFLDDIAGLLRDRWRRHIPVDLSHAAETAAERTSREAAEARDRAEQTAAAHAEIASACRKVGLWWPPGGGRPF